MMQRLLGTIALRNVAMCFVVLGSTWQAQAQNAATPYPSMAPLEQYLMEPSAEIALAKSAAPESISGDAEVMVLGRHRYETAVKGKNGFVCMVQRSWSAPIGDPEFWNPKLRAPICFNPPAARFNIPLLSKKRTWYWRDDRKRRFSRRSRPPSTRKNWRRRNRAPCATCFPSKGT